MPEMKTYLINNGVKLNCFTDDAFKTIRISVNMLLPMAKDTAALYGILPSVVTRATKEYPDYSALSSHLAGLYGSYLDSSVSKLGAYQVLSLSAGGIATQYAFDGENMVEELSKMLLGILFHPLRDENGLFPQENFHQEKRQLQEMFEAEYNDKIQYARQKCTELYFAGRPEGVHRYGSAEEVEALTLQQVSAAWGEMLEKARFEIFIMGNCNPDVASVQDLFGKLGTKAALTETVPVTGETETFTEEMPLSQSKLVMAFSADVREENKAAYRLMSAVFGGTPSAKLFVNVREKMGLCYYCASRMDNTAKFLMVESGVETENLEAAKAAVLEQLEELKRGNVTDEEILSAKLAVCNSSRSVNDSLNAAEGWYLSQALSPKLQTPEESVKVIMELTKEDIVDAANHITLKTVYTLKGRQN